MEFLDGNLARLIQTMADDINHISLVRSSRTAGETWQASCKREGEPGYSVAFHDDPAQALAVAIMTRKNGLPIEPGVRYWHHPESGSIFKDYEDDPAPNERDGLVEEIDRIEYGRLCYIYGIDDKPMPIKPHHWANHVAGDSEAWAKQKEADAMKKAARESDDDLFGSSDDDDLLG